MAKKPVDKEAWVEMLGNASQEFTAEVGKAIESIHTSYPNMLFQEKHTSGHLWWKRTWYTYYKYFEGSMSGVPIYSRETIKFLEEGK